MDIVTLNNGLRLPQLGIAVYQVRSVDCGPALAQAFQVGYRSVDTANFYLSRSTRNPAESRGAPCV